MGLAEEVGHALGGGEKGILAGDLVEQRTTPPDERVRRQPHAVAHGDNEVVQLDGGVEVVGLASLLEGSGEEGGGRADVAIGLTSGMGPGKGLGGPVVPAEQQTGYVVGLLPCEPPTEGRCSLGDRVITRLQGCPPTQRRRPQLHATRRSDPPAGGVRASRQWRRKLRRWRAHRKCGTSTPLGRRSHRFSHRRLPQLGYSAHSQ